MSKKVYGNFCLPGSRGGHPGFFFADRRHFLPPDRALFNICPYHIMNSVLISVHIHVDRNMGRLVDVLWTELWKPQGVDPHGSAGPWRPPGPPLCPVWAIVRPQGSREPGATRATRTGRGDRGAVELLAGLLLGEIFMVPKKKPARKCAANNCPAPA